jgi:hypothetical protein
MKNGVSPSALIRTCGTANTAIVYSHKVEKNTTMTVFLLNPGFSPGEFFLTPPAVTDKKVHPYGSKLEAAVPGHVNGHRVYCLGGGGYQGTKQYHQSEKRGLPLTGTKLQYDTAMSLY